MTTRVIETEKDRDMLCRFIKAQDLPFTISIIKGRKRSIAQNRLQRMWMSEISEQLGDRTPEEVRAYCKLRIGVPILRAENDLFAEKYDANVKPLPYEQKIAIMAEPLDMPITRMMTTDQKSRYLDEIARHFGEQGIALTQPDDLGRAA